MIIVPTNHVIEFCKTPAQKQALQFWITVIECLETHGLKCMALEAEQKDAR